ncbi:uncharacterized protein LOC144115410 isoform X4 [Amblyomma americanum]
MCTCVDTPSPAAFHFISCTFHSQRRYRQCHLKSTKRLKSCLVLGKHEIPGSLPTPPDTVEKRSSNVPLLFYGQDPVQQHVQVCGLQEL